MPRASSRILRYLTIFVGAFAGFGIITYLADVEKLPVLIAPLAASTCIIYIVPRSKFAQPSNVVGGHMLSSLVGSAIYLSVGANWFSSAICVALAILLMEVTGLMHPPAAATSIIALSTGQAFSFALAPVGLGAVIIVMTGIVLHRALLKSEYPRRRRHIRMAHHTTLKKRDRDAPSSRL